MENNLQVIVVIYETIIGISFLICYISCMVSFISLIRVFKFLRLDPRGKRRNIIYKQWGIRESNSCGF
jgi:hypothetical protein